MPTVSVIYFSGSGHTAKMAEAVHKGAASVAGAKTNLIAINGDDIVKGRYANEAVLAQLDASDAIIFGSATYMGGPAAQFKALADATGERWARRRLAR
jgi:NAD(P)H dehydrogenase (quinone)